MSISVITLPRNPLAGCTAPTQKRYTPGGTSIRDTMRMPFGVTFGAAASGNIEIDIRLVAADRFAVSIVEANRQADVHAIASVLGRGPQPLERHLDDNGDPGFVLGGQERRR